MSLYDAVCFDLFDTLITYDSLRYRNDHWRAAIELGLDRSEFIAAWNQTQNAAKAGIYERIEERCKAVLKQVNIETDEAIDKLIQLEIKALKNSVQLIQGVDHMMKTLVSHGTKLAIISNSTCTGLKILSLLEIDHYFTSSFFSFFEKLWKPDPALYLLACDRLKVKPARTAYVSDGDRGELQGAASAGLLPVQFDPTNQYPHTPVPPGTIKAATTDVLLALLLG